MTKRKEPRATPALTQLAETRRAETISILMSARYAVVLLVGTRERLHGRIARNATHDGGTFEIAPTGLDVVRVIAVSDVSRASLIINETWAERQRIAREQKERA